MKTCSWIAAVLTAALLLGLAGCAAPGGSGNIGKDGAYEVSFYADDGTLLKVDRVAKNASATPPAVPQMAYGSVFRAWDTDFSCVTKKMEVHPVCESVKGKSNAFAIAGAYGKPGDTAVVPVTLCGDVCVAGFDAVITYDPEKLELLSLTEDEAVIVNTGTPGEIRLNYVSVENTVADVDVCRLEFRVKAESGTAPVQLEMCSIYACSDTVDSQDDTLYTPEFTVIHGEVFVIGQEA